jgi:hypothetical protein
MVIGARESSRITEDPSHRRFVYAKGAQVMERFRSLHGSTVCRELLGCDISTPEGAKYADDHDLTKLRCEQFVKDAVAILENGEDRG